MCTGKICSPGILTRQRTIRFLLGLQCGGGRSYTEKKQTYERLGSWHACCDLYPATCAAACVWPYRIGAVVLLFLPASVLWPGKPPWASLSVTVAVSVDLYFVLHSSMQCGRLHNPNGTEMRNSVSREKSKVWPRDTYKKWVTSAGQPWGEVKDPPSEKWRGHCFVEGYYWGILGQWGVKYERIKLLSDGWYLGSAARQESQFLSMGVIVIWYYGLRWR